MGEPEGAFVRGPWTDRRSGRKLHGDDPRSDFEVDYARVIHSGSFRRLQGKTQILALGDDDFYRTRLTHSLEVAQIAGGIVQKLGHERDDAIRELIAPKALFPTLGLAHDLGHPPFGHGGEQALDASMAAAGGFEGNAQTLRILTRLECFSPTHGADVTRRTLLGVLKYPVRRSDVVRTELDEVGHAAKAYYDDDQDVFDWVTEPFSDGDRRALALIRERPSGHARSVHKSFDCSLMDAADDIAYGVHDLEDAIALGLVERDRFAAAVDEKVCAGLLTALAERPLEDGGTYHALMSALFGDEGRRKRAIGRLVHHLIRNVSVPMVDGFEHPLLARRVALGSEARALLDALQTVIVDEVIDAARVQQLEYKGRRMVASVFEALASDPRRLLPREVGALVDRSGARAISDYVASMTDGSLLKTYERLFSPRMGSVFDHF
ncbi:anti-phage deoxyguanosine triphosphatase [Sphingomonas sp. CLY1604]|uniref:anti-phage deoxyguanosine triphosphatase n=1 Tax=Sphingomonas sp. CLY1604 TaxID=3457786 RepID=UPI003FD8AE98